MKHLTSILLATSLVFVGCDDDDDLVDDGLDDGIDDDADGDGIPPSALVWRTDLAGIGPYGGLTGQSSVQQLQGAQAFTAVAALRGDVPNSIRPWHVHFGTCATGGDIVGADLAYPRLAIGTDGSATAMARVEATLEPGASYHVNIHFSDEQLENIIACGDLVRSQ